jgi:hypothetical protein
LICRAKGKQQAIHMQRSGRRSRPQTVHGTEKHVQAGCIQL